jgi:hypothetical protein
MKVHEIVLSDFRNLCRHARESSDFEPIKKSVLTVFAMNDNQYRDIILEALKYYFYEKDFKKYIKEEMKLDEQELESRSKEEIQVL